MREHESLSKRIDGRNARFTESVKKRLLEDLTTIHDEHLTWLVMEHYQFSAANAGLLQVAVSCTAQLANPAVSLELRRNLEEEDGHAAMYKRGMFAVGVDMDDRTEFTPTTEFLGKLRKLASVEPSRVLGVLYATETAAIFEHETFFDVCAEICRRRDFPYEGSTIKAFHDLHLSGGVEQGHKDGLSVFVDSQGHAGEVCDGVRIDREELLDGAMEAIEVMETWWNTLLEVVIGPTHRKLSKEALRRSLPRSR